jgi:hypothetical protein
MIRPHQRHLHCLAIRCAIHSDGIQGKRNSSDRSFYRTGGIAAPNPASTLIGCFSCPFWRLNIVFFRVHFSGGAFPSDKHCCRSKHDWPVLAARRKYFRRYDTISFFPF